MENKPTIREEFIERYLCLYDTDMSGFGTNLIDEIADWWLNKIKEVVGEEETNIFGFRNKYTTPQNNKRVGRNELRQRILKEFGIIKQ